MNVILLSGGSGKRLWPLSNDVRSKQFIKIIKNENGSLESMVQRVYRQILSCDKTANITIATSEAQIPVLRNQLGDNIDISVEPCRKDTFPAIVLSSLYLRDIKKISSEDEIVVLPVDPYVENDYFIAIKKLYDVMHSYEANIGLLGITPTYPSEKYGYILPQGLNTNSVVFNVDRFAEKPNKEEAKRLIDLGALWNAGVFCFKLKYIINKAHELYNFTNYYDFLNMYSSLNKISFDYAIVEKERNILGVKYNGEWKDIGTWGTLTSILTNNVIGNAMLDKKSINTNILNELNIPIIGMGLKDLIIAASPDGIFVSDKDESSYNKPLVDKLDNRPMYEERSWGEFQVLDIYKNSLVKHIFIKEGKSISYQKHNHRDEVWTIIDGEGILILDDIERKVFVSDVIHIKKGVKHKIKAVKDIHFIEIQYGDEISEDDIERFD